MLRLNWPEYFKSILSITLKREESSVILNIPKHRKVVKGKFKAKKYRYGFDWTDF